MYLTTRNAAADETSRADTPRAAATTCTIDPMAIFEKCKQDLEPNFIPTYLQLVDEIPKTISEKALDRVLKKEFSPDAENVYTQS